MTSPKTDDERRAELLARIRESQARMDVHREAVLRAIAQMREQAEHRRRRRWFVWR